MSNKIRFFPKLVESRCFSFICVLYLKKRIFVMEKAHMDEFIKLLDPGLDYI